MVGPAGVHLLYSIRYIPMQGSPRRMEVHALAVPVRGLHASHGPWSETAAIEDDSLCSDSWSHNAAASENQTSLVARSEARKTEDK